MTFLPGFYLRNQVTPYVILFIERDGSTYLSSLLASHPEIQAVYERFAVMRQKGQGAREQLDWARGFFTPGLINRAAAVGFKTKLVDVLDHEGFAQLLIEKNCHIIQMRRHNRIKAVISRINARRLHEASGNWNLYKEEDRQPPVAIDLAEFDAFLKEREAADNELDSYTQKLRLPTLEISYEELMLDRDAILQKVFSFLQVKPKPVAGKTLKHTSDNLRDVVLNFDELQMRYASTQYEPMFEEVLAVAAT